MQTNQGIITDLFDFEEPRVRPKSRRTRIKESRARRDIRRFFVVLGGKLRARDTGIRTHAPDRRPDR